MQNDVRLALRDLLDYADRQRCSHEDAVRGGIGWTICQQCGGEWADDQGGIPPYVDPPAVARARLICDAPDAPVASDEVPGVLCYIAHDRTWFTTAPLDKQWGDDWDDAPYEDNAGSPYAKPDYKLTVVPFDPGSLATPTFDNVHVGRSVKQINAGEAPWLSGHGYAVRAGADSAEFQAVLQRCGGTAFMPWPDLAAERNRLACKVEGMTENVSWAHPET